jgi:site-specific recombinase XerD
MADKELVTLSGQERDRNGVIPAGYEALPWSRDSIQLVPAHSGRFRGNNSSFRARTDAEAVDAWLATKSKESDNTRAKYLREVERLLLWAASRDQVLSDLTSEDFDEYSEFLENPLPYSTWVTDRRYPKSDKRWRPFIGPLSSQSRFQSLSVVYSMLSYLSRKGWLTVVALDAPKAPKAIAENQNEAHSLSRNQEAAIREAVREIPKAIRRLQARFHVELLLAAGPRTSEMVEANMRDIQPEVIEGKTYIVWRVVGKGNKPRAIPLQPSAIKAMEEFRLALGLSPRPDRNEPPYPIAASLRGLRAFEPHTFRPITRQSLYARFQKLYLDAAKILSKQGLNDEAVALQSATTHTYRHTALKALADATGGDMRKVMKLAGHSSLATAGKYTRSSLADLADALDSMESGK